MLGVKTHQNGFKVLSKGFVSATLRVFDTAFYQSVFVAPFNLEVSSYVEQIRNCLIVLSENFSLLIIVEKAVFRRLANLKR